MNLFRIFFGVVWALLNSMASGATVVTSNYESQATALTGAASNSSGILTNQDALIDIEFQRGNQLRDVGDVEASGSEISVTGLGVAGFLMSLDDPVRASFNKNSGGSATVASSVEQRIHFELGISETAMATLDFGYSLDSSGSVLGSSLSWRIEGPDGNVVASNSYTTNGLGQVDSEILTLVEEGAYTLILNAEIPSQSVNGNRFSLVSFDSVSLTLRSSIPEPSGVFLLMLAGSLGCLRRSRESIKSSG